MHLKPIRNALLVTGLAACASGGTTPAPPHDPTAIAIAAATVARWTGTLQPTQSRTGGVKATERQKAYGTVELVVPRNRRTRTHVRLDVSAPATAGVTTLRWGIYPGSCGSGAPPVFPTEVFPAIELGTNGKGSIDQEVAFEMPDAGRFHVNVLQGTGTQLSNVLTCANLRLAK